MTPPPPPGSGPLAAAAASTTTPTPPAPPTPLLPINLKNQYNPKIHFKKKEVAQHITFSGLRNHQVDIDMLTEEAIADLDISSDAVSYR